MAEVTRQSDHAAAGRVSREVQIYSIRLASGFFEGSDADLDTSGFHTEYFANVKSITDDEVVIIVGFRLADHREGESHGPTAQDSSAEGSSPLSVFADFELTYNLNHPVPHEDAEPFAWMNGVYNAWPFWRALVHMMLPQMGLRPLVVPVFRLPRPQLPQKKSTSRVSTSRAAGPESVDEAPSQRGESAAPKKQAKPKSTRAAAKRPQPRG